MDMLRHRRRKPARAAAVLGSLLAAGCGAGGPPSAPEDPAEAAIVTEGVPEEHLTNPIAVVNGVSVYRSTYEEILDILRERAQGGGPGAVEEYIGAKVKALEKAVDEELLFQEAVRRGHDPSPSQVRAAYLERVRRSGGETPFLASARARGVSKFEVLASLRRALALDGFVKAVEAEISHPTEEEVRAHYDARPDLFTSSPYVRIGHVFVRAPRDSDAMRRSAALSKIAGSLEKIRSGRPFEEVAREDGEDETARNGGLLGYFRPGMFPEEIERAVFDTPPGGVTEILEGEYGYHVVKVLERKGGTLEPFERVRDEARTSLVARRRGDRLRALVDRLRGEGRIERLEM
jgi:peptidyl-prolyl cis-trans isomerase C